MDNREQDRHPLRWEIASIGMALWVIAAAIVYLVVEVTRRGPGPRVERGAARGEQARDAGILGAREGEDGGCAMSETYGTFSTAYVEAMRLRLSALEAENKDMRDRFSDADTERNAAQAALKAAFDRVAELEALEKQRADDEAWGRENVVVTGNASAWIFSRRPETLTYGNSIAAAIRALRKKMEARP